MIRREDVKVDPNPKDIVQVDLCLSLTKLLGKKIKDIEGYPTYEESSSEIVFKLTGIIMEDDTEIGVEAEHDCPYLVTYPDQEQSNLDNSYFSMGANT